MQSELSVEIAHLKHGAPIMGTVLRYFLLAGLAYFIFYVWKKQLYYCAKIQWRYPEKKHLYREIFYSIISTIIFGISAGFAFWADGHGYSLSYKNISDHGWVYFFFSIVLMIFIHDAYFYWLHRLMHWKPLFRTVHKVHHLSVNPSPFAAFAFHPVEGFTESLIFPIVAFTVPHHIAAILIFSTYSVLLNVMGHVGFEFFPKYFARHWLFKWHNSATHHNMHHSHVKCNFGLYFNLWDRVMKTNHPEYETRFEKVTTIRDEAQVAQKHQTGIIRKVKAPAVAEQPEPEPQPVSV